MLSEFTQWPLPGRIYSLEADHPHTLNSNAVHPNRTFSVAVKRVLEGMTGDTQREQCDESRPFFLLLNISVEVELTHSKLHLF